MSRIRPSPLACFYLLFAGKLAVCPAQRIVGDRSAQQSAQSAPYLGKLTHLSTVAAIDRDQKYQCIKC